MQGISYGGNGSVFPGYGLSQDVDDGTNLSDALLTEMKEKSSFLLIVPLQSDKNKNKAMKWLLLAVVMGTCAMASAQSTLKIFVTNDDVRTDMAIIDMNTSAITRYGKSMDSTNVQFYTVTMSTQVLRLSYKELFGEDESEVVPQAEMVNNISEEIEKTELITLDAPTASIDDFFKLTLQEDVPKKKSIQSSAATRSQSSKLGSSSNATNIQRRSPPSNTNKRKVSKRSKLKKPRRSRKYKGQCPKFF